MSLESTHILVTRPYQQSHHLSHLIEQQGGKPVVYPVIEIKDLSKNNIALQQLQSSLQQYQKIIWVSANAVLYSVPWLLKQGRFPADLEWVVVGKTTEKNLKSLLSVEVICPPEFNSESLLTLPQFNTNIINNKKIAIIKGEGGRHLLTDTLGERGALVDEIKVYRRCLPQNPPLIKQKIDCIVITSSEGLYNLFKMLPDADWIKHTPLVLISARLVSIAKQLGIDAPLFIAPTATDAGLLNALLTWRKSHANPDQTSGT